MVDRDNREDWRRERSLLALGEAMRGEDDASLVAIGDRANQSWREDAAERHRLARAQRETRSAPSADTEPGGLQADHQPISHEPRIGDDWTARTGYARAQAREEPAGLSHGRAPQAALDPRQASNARQPAFEDADDQQWKPLIDPMQVVRGIARSKALILSTTILGAALGVAIALSTPKKYEATAELIVDPRDLKLTDRDLTQNVVASDATLAIVENQVRVLTSGTVLNKVVDKLNLTNDPEFNGQGSGGLGVMSMIRSILSRHDAGAADEGRRRALAVGNLAESLSVERGGKTFVISVGATTQNGEKSALIANTMTDVFLQTFGQIQSDTAGRATDELTARLDELRKGVEAAERKVEDYRATHDLVDAQGHLISDDQMLKLNEQLSVARARTLELNARAASARSLSVNSVLNGTLPEEINSNTMGELRAQYAALKQEADRAAVRLGPRHPELQALSAQLAGARDRIAAELQRIASSLQVDLKRSVQLEQDLASRLAQAKVQSGDVNNALVSLRELEREAAAKRSVYEAFLLRAKETGEQKDINTANINVISKAFAPLEAKGPSRAMLALAGLLLGFAAGVGLGGMRGAYESLRETATSRSRRRANEDHKPAVEDKVYRPPLPVPLPRSQPRAPSPPAPASAATTGAERSGPVGALLSAVRGMMPGKRQKPVDPGKVTERPAAYQPRQFQQDEPPRRPAMHPAQRAQASDDEPGYRPARPEQTPPAGYSHPLPAQAGGQGANPRDQLAPQAPDTDEQQGQIDEIRESLREFREAVRELTESRSNRRYF
ncbi:succinoglycan biosynthesis protein exop [Mesorhizobium sp. M4B.F.Ca.ET.190.01.1.1]|uniref:Wzz/FepE/Etk N-terminal domain-containing protein n=1 Tax=unclassified Mesorhizobium TaxID=325217 RepID=UPI000FE8177E|nr:MULTISPECIES: Wzz/FepE/Etk N-terminal domain-containing protein [unclassified Mesorhizobium]RWF66933.1 MAG: succinoglycan biosynthesis protein exop [Mesorhizobium sp.]TGR08275.1 succinoglycan biosynthesis protein exop [Mesorhizobium sp. M4B.F.Ca.ET.200.01.1.1]TGS17632.1 succinoglycan biosynthesis protein exop [Mesorhizobium sp. M4B.F.Ca.ET.190.01.1.1]TGT29956.1 succinoglycan biosynthesis protein exop [Mesorhizobium sp. M4B.F.Ca.ET.172.01.1.1]